MRKLFLVVALLIGCGGGGNSRIGTEPGDAGVVPLGDGGVTQPPDAGADAGVFVPLGDGGFIQQGDCVNEIQRIPQQPREHVQPDVPLIYTNNPPVSGPHWGWGWAHWAIHTDPVPRGYYVHNLEHGGVIFLYRPDVSHNLVDVLVRVYQAVPLDPECMLEPIPHSRSVLTPDPLLDADWAVTVSGPEEPTPESDLGVGFVIKANCIRDEQALVDFAVQRRNHGAEMLCQDGLY